MADGDKYLIPHQEDLPLPLGRAGVWHDPRNREHRALGQVSQTTPTERKRPWHGNHVYDQIGPSCTVGAGVGVAMTMPFRQKFKQFYDHVDTEQERHDFYVRVKKYDPWEGENYDGSSTDAPFRLMRELGWITGWKWLFGLNELRTFLQFYGAVSVGTLWPRSFFYPNKKGELEWVDADGIAGGHAWRITFYDPDTRRYRKVGTWGRGWGENGRAWVREETMERLLAENGEAATIVL